jgi:hypothetical protein
MMDEEPAARRRLPALPPPGGLRLSWGTTRLRLDRALAASRTIASSAPWPILCAATLLAICAAAIIGRQLFGGLYVEDDAYYYILIARNLARTGVSTFDHQSLTNGYHPLWLGLLTLKELLLGPSLFGVVMVQAVLLAIGAFCLLRQAPAQHPVLQAGFLCAFAVLIGPIGLDGMETALLVGCLGLFVLAMAGASGPRRGWWLGVAAAACVGGRIDSAVFILPALALAPASRATRLTAFAVLAVAGAAYAILNLAVFGAVTPVSSAIKSLGGLQLNHPLIDQLKAPFDRRRHALFYALTLGALAASPGLVPLSKPGTVGRALALASAVGGLLYVVKLLFLSSWVVWPWYNFAVLFPLTAAFYVLGPRIQAALEALQARFIPARWSTAAVTATALVILAATAAAVHPFKQDNGFATINRIAAARYGPALNGARVAMGDRAGSFAAAYGGPVVQLEGLVNDVAYLKVLARGEDPRPLLCRRGVAYVLGYETDLGAYDHARIAVLRPNLTQFTGPALDVWRSDEIGRVRDLRVFDNSVNGEVADDTLYIWKLRC